MKKKHTYHGCQSYIDFHINKPKYIMPKIISTKIIEGVRYYFSDDGRQFIADVFDRTWLTISGKIMNKFYKGEIIGHRGY